MLLNRLKPYLSDLVTTYQSAFVEGRAIYDNILIAHEVFHHLQTRTKIRMVECALTVDIQKAFDRVEWDFQLRSLANRGFREKWMRECLTNTYNRVMINGQRTCTIQPSRGLRQGDPLLPYLFILVRDVLSRQVEKAD